MTQTSLSEGLPLSSSDGTLPSSLLPLDGSDLADVAPGCSFIIYRFVSPVGCTLGKGLVLIALSFPQLWRYWVNICLSRASLEAEHTGGVRCFSPPRRLSLPWTLTLARNLKYRRVQHGQGTEIDNDDWLCSLSLDCHRDPDWFWITRRLKEPLEATPMTPYGNISLSRVDTHVNQMNWKSFVFNLPFAKSSGLGTKMGSRYVWTDSRRCQVYYLKFCLEVWVTALTALKWCTLGRAESQSNPAPSGPETNRTKWRRGGEGADGKAPPPISLHSSDSKTRDPSNTGQIISPWYKDKQQNQIFYLLLNP